MKPKSRQKVWVLTCISEIGYKYEVLGVYSHKSTAELDKEEYEKHNIDDVYEITPMEVI